MALLGFAAYAYFAGTPAGSTALQTSPTPTVSSPTPTIPAAASTTPGTVTSSAPATTPITEASASTMPPDSVFIDAAMAAYASGVGSAQNKYYTGFQTMLTTCVAEMQLDPTIGAEGQPGTGDNCSGQQQNVTFKQILGLSSTGADVGVSALATAGVITSTVGGALTLGITAVVAVIGAIFAHHAQKVQEQAQYDCAASAAANNAWSEIQNAIAGGTLNASSAQAAFEAVYQQVQQLLSKSPAPSNMGGGNCNNPCRLILICRAITDKFEAAYGLEPSAGYPS